MLKAVDFYYFSPTGGTKKAGMMIAEGMAEQVQLVNLGTAGAAKEGSEDVAVVAAPVFGGRIPALVSEKMKQMNGAGKKIVTVVVYGVRAYDDALLELNDVVTEAGFEVAASAAVIAQHSMVPAVGAGRPDAKDAEELKAFAVNILKKLEEGSKTEVTVPGKHPYCPELNLPAAPLSLDSCVSCGACAAVCPVSAVKLEDGKVVTDVQACMMCLACTTVCPTEARIIPPPMKETMTGKLSPLCDVRKENEFYL